MFWIIENNCRVNLIHNDSFPRRSPLFELVRGKIDIYFFPRYILLRFFQVLTQNRKHIAVDVWLIDFFFKWPVATHGSGSAFPVLPLKLLPGESLLRHPRIPITMSPPSRESTRKRGLLASLVRTWENFELRPVLEWSHCVQGRFLISWMRSEKSIPGEPLSVYSWQVSPMSLWVFSGSLPPPKGVSVREIVISTLSLS